MKQENKHLYEGMYILSATLSDDARQKALEKIEQGIVSRGGQVLKVHPQGRKRLAYQIDTHKEGYFYVLYFEVVPSAIADMWREYHLNEDLIRFMTMRADRVVEEITFKPLVEVQ